MNLYRMTVTDEKHLHEHGTVHQAHFYVLAHDMLDAIESTPRAKDQPIDWVRGELLPGPVFVGKLVPHDGR